jgi:peptidoglycan-associated lipoprotein
MIDARVAMAVVLVLSVTAVNCSRRNAPAARPIPSLATVEEAPPPSVLPAPEPPSAPDAAAAPLTADEIFARKTLDELNAERPLGDALFDYDQFVIRADARPVLQANAEWLRRWPSTRVVIEGHGDARGTSQYNLALGERRAHAAWEYLAALGVDADRMLAVSKGEESPMCFEEHEACWQQNRRAHFIITAK